MIILLVGLLLLKNTVLRLLSTLFCCGGKDKNKIAPIESTNKYTFKEGTFFKFSLIIS